LGFEKLWEEQRAWLDGGLANSTADWQIVVTHYPADLGDWKELSAKHGIDMIISGHRHDREVYYHDAGNALWPTAVLVSGAGGGVTSEAVPDINGDDDQYGFLELQLSKKEILVRSISHGGVLRSTTSVRARPSEKELQRRWMSVV
jgi:phosphodiesterase/alkaline phosphatase D-like protein